MLNFLANQLNGKISNVRIKNKKPTTSFIPLFCNLGRSRFGHHDLIEAYTPLRSASSQVLSTLTRSEALLHSARTNDIEAVRRILGAQPNLVNQTEVLAVAAFYGYEQIVKYLVEEAGANINDCINGYGTPLCCATSKAKGSLVEYLLANGAEVNLHNSGLFCRGTPLQVCLTEMKDAASEKLHPKYIPILGILIAHGANTDVSIPHSTLPSHDYIQSLEGNPELKEEALAILSSKKPSLDALTSLMSNLHLEGEVSVDGLLCAMSRLSLQTTAVADTTSSNRPR